MKFPTAFCIAFLNIMPAFAGAQVNFTVEPIIGVANYPLGTANSINNRGQITGEVPSPAGPTTTAYLYDHGVITTLGKLGTSQGFGVAINDQGQIAGTAGSGQIEMAFSYLNGTQTALGRFSNIGSRSVAINNLGQILGTSQAEPSNYPNPFLYENGVMRNLYTTSGISQIFPGDGCDATAINDKGQIIYSGYLPGGQGYRSVISDGSKFIFPGALPSQFPQTNLRALNNNGQAVGYSGSAPNIENVVLYSNGALRDLGRIQNARHNSAYDINDKGEIVGSGYNTFSTDGTAFYSNGIQLYDLNSLIPSTSGWRLVTAKSINDKGQIVGEGYFNGGWQAYLLTPVAQVPEPGFLALVAGAGSVMLCRSFRKRARR